MELPLHLTWLSVLLVVRFWIDRGVTIFRVDNPHTKPINFWAWLIDTVHDERPDVIFLAGAFTVPAMMAERPGSGSASRTPTSSGAPARPN